MENEIYLYGMIVRSHSFMLKDDFLTPDEYSELSAAYSFIGGETGTCATVLSSLGASVRIDGTHIGYKIAPMLKDFYKGTLVDINSLYFDETYDGLDDYIIISGDIRTPMGMFGSFYADAYETGICHWNTPKEDDIKACKVAAIDPYFTDDTDIAVDFCVKHGKPYVTIDCSYDRYIHKNAAISVISGESIKSNYPDKTREELFPFYTENSNGLTIITNGGKEFFYGRKGEKMHTFTPYKVNVASTLGAGDTFKAGCTYALLKGMSDIDTVKFASACAAVAISRYPLQLNPPTLTEIEQLIK